MSVVGNNSTGWFHPGIPNSDLMETGEKHSEQQRCNECTLTPNRLHPLSLLESVPEISDSQRQGLTYVVVHLRRSSLSDAWGIAFSMFDDRVVLGKSGPGHVFYPQALQLHAIGMASPNLMHQQLLPGDLLLSIDGYDPGYFQSLNKFTSYLRSLQQCSLVLLRHSDATSAAMAHWNASICRHPPPPIDLPFRAATSADTIWVRVLSRPSPVNPVGRGSGGTGAASGSILRQVTPDRCMNEASDRASFSDPRSLFGDEKGSVNPLDLLSRVAASSNASSDAFQAARIASTAALHKSQTGKPKTAIKSPKKPKDFHIPSHWRNPLYRDMDGNIIPYDDNWEFSPEDGTRAKLFLPPIDNFVFWLGERKQRWKHKYTVFKHASEKRDEDEVEVEKRIVAHNFWSPQGFASFQEWMTIRLTQWKLSYAWNKKKRQRIQKECQAVVHISQESREFQQWLRIRRNQWRLLRRKRQRQRHEQTKRKRNAAEGRLQGRDQVDLPPNVPIGNGESHQRKRRVPLSPASTDIAAIDVILEQEDEEWKRRKSEKRELIDIYFLFDASHGAPDDVVVHCLSFLDCTEYSKLLCISKTYANALKSREEVWRQLCPSHWILPRRPRKPWHELYFHKLRVEQRNSQKLWDDLLVKCSGVLSKGDHLQKLEKLVSKGEEDFGFHVNYVSPVVCERNSILNLAVIHQRHKVVRWLVDQKSADIESCDRGRFTALLNAAWSGDRQLVRFLLQRGADRSKVGYSHYSRALPHPDFEGLTAEGWAKKRDHDDIAELIRLGL